MQILRPTESEALGGWDPASWVLTSPPGGLLHAQVGEPLGERQLHKVPWLPFIGQCNGGSVTYLAFKNRDAKQVSTLFQSLCSLHCTTLQRLSVPSTGHEGPFNWWGSQHQRSTLYFKWTKPDLVQRDFNSGYVLSIFFFNFFNVFIYLFMAVLGLRFCARAFSNCGKRGPLFIAVRGPLTVAASLVAEHRLQTRRLSNCGSRA